MRSPGLRRLRRKSLARRAYRMSGPILAGVLLALAGFAVAEDLRSYAVVGDAIPQSLTAHGRRCGARAGARGRTLRRLRSSAAAGRSSRSRNSQATWRPSLAGSGGRCVGGSAQASAGGRLTSRCRDRGAVLLWRRRPQPRRDAVARRADPVGRADRGYRGVSRKLARIGRRRCSSRPNSSRRQFPGPRRWRRRAWRDSPSSPFDPAEATPAMLASAIQSVTGGAAVRAGKVKLRHPAAGRGTATRYR